MTLSVVSQEFKFWISFSLTYTLVIGCNIVMGMHLKSGRATICPVIDGCYDIKRGLVACCVGFLLLPSEHAIPCSLNSLGNDDRPCVPCQNLSLYLLELMFVAITAVTVQLYSLVGDILCL